MRAETPTGRQYWQAGQWGAVGWLPLPTSLFRSLAPTHLVPYGVCPTACVGSGKDSMCLHELPESQG